jgi:hypothetical protein
MYTRPLIHWGLVGLAAISLVLVIVDVILGQSIRSIQADVNQRQQFINQSIRLGRVNEGLIRTIAQAALKDNSDKLRDLLMRNGITVNPATAPAGTATPTPAPAPSKDK